MGLADAIPPLPAVPLTELTLSGVGIAVLAFLLRNGLARFRALEEREASRVRSLEQELAVERTERKREVEELRGLLRQSGTDYARCEAERASLQGVVEGLREQLDHAMERITTLEARLTPVPPAAPIHTP